LQYPNATLWPLKYAEDVGFTGMAQTAGSHIMTKQPKSFSTVPHQQADDDIRDKAQGAGETWMEKEAKNNAEIYEIGAVESACELIQLAEKDDIRDEEQTASEGCAVAGSMANVEINENVEVESSDEVKRQLARSDIITEELSADKVEQVNVNGDLNEIGEV
jgi:hypothetical protein